MLFQCKFDAAGRSWRQRARRDVQGRLVNEIDVLGKILAGTLFATLTSGISHAHARWAADSGAPHIPPGHLSIGTLVLGRWLKEQKTINNITSV